LKTAQNSWYFPLKEIHITLEKTYSIFQITMAATLFLHSRHIFYRWNAIWDRISSASFLLIIHIKLIHDTRGKHLHDRIISQREEIWANKTITAPLCIEAHVPIPASEWSSICVLGYRFWLCLRFSLGFRICSDKVILLFILFSAYQFSVIDFSQVLHIVYFRALDLLLNIVTSLSLYHISRLILKHRKTTTSKDIFCLFILKCECVFVTYR
jgi:hypothetical protein